MLSLEQFEQLWSSSGTSPEGAVKCLLVAVLETYKEQNPDGKKMWGMVLPKNELDGQGHPGRGQQLALSQFARQIKGTRFNGAIAASYLGGTPNNGYQHAYEQSLAVDEHQSRRSEKEAKLFVRSGGKDLPSPVSLKQNKSGYWKIFEYSSLLTGVRPVPDDDF